MSWAGSSTPRSQTAIPEARELLEPHLIPDVPDSGAGVVEVEAAGVTPLHRTNLPRNRQNQGTLPVASHRGRVFGLELLLELRPARPDRI